MPAILQRRTSGYYMIKLATNLRNENAINFSYITRWGKHFQLKVVKWQKFFVDFISDLKKYFANKEQI